MKVSKQQRSDAKKLFKSCFKDGLLDEGKAFEVVKALVEKKPRGYMGIAFHFERLVRLDVANRTATVESAVALDDSQQASIRGKLTTLYGSNLILGFAENKDLIGGMRIKVGSNVFDGSVRGRLSELASSF